MKINVVGTSGSGKSTLARQLAERLDAPYIEMDRLYWRPEWQGTPDDAFLARLEQALAEAGEGWVLDGNYSRTQPIKWREVDYILWLDYGFGRTLWQAVRRACRRAASKRELWPGTGNRESFRRSFFSRESIVLWTVRTYAKNRRKYLAEMAGAGRCFIRLRSPRQAADFLRALPQGHSSRR
ncbi:AAA family ATPase [Serratia sp. IR-2025]